MPAHECNRYHALPLAVPLGLCSCRWMWCCFVLCKVSSIIMTVAINAHYLPLVDFYAPALLASRFFLRLLRPAMLAHPVLWL